VITLGEHQADNINRIITIGELLQTLIFECVSKQQTVNSINLKCSEETSSDCIQNLMCLSY